MAVSFDPQKHTPDVSHWEGVIDFDLFRPRRINTKLTEGRNFGDPLAGYVMRHAREMGIPREVFHFITTWDGVAEQLQVLQAALFGVYADDPASPVDSWLDLEGRSLSAVWRALGTLGIRRKLRPLVIALWRVGRAMFGKQLRGFYTGMSFWNSYVGTIDWEAEELPAPELWAADYGLDGVGGGITGPRYVNLKTWVKGWFRWQFTDKGRAPGVPGALDLNIDRPESDEPPPTTDLFRVKASVLNVRTGPGIGYHVIRQLQYGVLVTVSEESEGWGHIGESEWVSLAWLTKSWEL